MESAWEKRPIRMPPVTAGWRVEEMLDEDDEARLVMLMRVAQRSSKVRRAREGGRLSVWGMVVASPLVTLSFPYFAQTVPPRRAPSPVYRLDGMPWASWTKRVPGQAPERLMPMPTKAPPRMLASYLLNQFNVALGRVGFWYPNLSRTWRTMLPKESVLKWRSVGSLEQKSAGRVLTRLMLRQ